jgi:hypothetical protein
MKKLTVGVFCAFLACPAFAYDYDCLLLKTDPQVRLTVPEWTKEVVQPLQPMDLLHGNVIASLREEYDLQAELEQVEDGFCLVLRGVSATVGYTDFMVQIDSRHKPDSCAYNLTMEHEDEHIRAHLSVIDDMKGEIESAVETAAGAVMPMFVETRKDAADALDKMNREIQQHPAVVLANQKIKAEQEIRNKKIDQREDGIKINQCITREPSRHSREGGNPL